MSVDPTGCMLAARAGPTLLNASMKPPSPRSTAYAVLTPKTAPTPVLILRQLALANPVTPFDGAAPMTGVVLQLRAAAPRSPASVASASACGGSFGPEAYISANFSRGS